MSRKVIGLLNLSDKSGMIYLSQEIRNELCQDFPCKLIVELNESDEIVIRPNR